MACHKIFLVISLMLVVSLVNAVEFSVIDNTGDSPGGKIFREQIGGASYGEQAMRSATDFVWRVFQQDNPSDRRDTPMITLIMENSKDLAYSSQDKIHYNAGALVNDGGDVKRGFNGVIYHEVVHSWQWNGANLAPVGLIEGIADFVRLKAGFAASHWVAPGGDVTMRFLDYCNELRNGFVAELNKKMRTGYNDVLGGRRR